VDITVLSVSVARLTCAVLLPCACLLSACCWCCPWLQAENVLALVNARTAAAADSALAGLQGGLGQLVSELRADVLSIITELEARLDFDEDLPPLDVEQLKQDIAGEGPVLQVNTGSSKPCVRRWQWQWQQLAVRPCAARCCCSWECRQTTNPRVPSSLTFVLCPFCWCLLYLLFMQQTCRKT
jgi:hypothetical protein